MSPIAFAEIPKRTPKKPRKKSLKKSPRSIQKNSQRHPGSNSRSNKRLLREVSGWTPREISGETPRKPFRNWRRRSSYSKSRQKNSWRNPWMTSSKNPRKNSCRATLWKITKRLPGKFSRGTSERIAGTIKKNPTRISGSNDLGKTSGRNCKNFVGLSWQTPKKKTFGFQELWKILKEEPQKELLISCKYTSWNPWVTNSNKKPWKLRKESCKKAFQDVFL